jgi:GNAT superfamily N-acetyltransferase
MERGAGVEMRLMTAADVSAVAALHTLSWQRGYRGVLSDAWLDAHAAANRTAIWARRFSATREREAGLVAHTEGVLTGFIYLIADADPVRGASVDNLHVHPDRTGGGIGRRLLGAGARLAMTREWPDGLHLWVYEANLDARRFYARHGGTVVERVSYDAADGGSYPSLCFQWDRAAAATLAGDGSDPLLRADAAP